MKCIIITIFSLILLVALGGLLFIYSGSYNVAATSKDPGLLKWILKTTREQSIDSRYEKITPPDKSVLTNPKTLRIGFDHYNEMCIVCHGAPGIEPGEARAGLNPKPPILARIAKKMPDRELFWVIKHGIKMTGMPAWGPTHSDDKIWAMVAFVKTLPGMTPAQYKALQAQAGTDKSDHHHHD
ncbi:MAG: cytochrome c [Gammaproteobacteria bacterium]